VECLAGVASLRAGEQVSRRNTWSFAGIIKEEWTVSVLRGGLAKYHEPLDIIEGAGDIQRRIPKGFKA
jgi:hypothetical protein